jgi:lipopolysaccharide export system protein LptA
MNDMLGGDGKDRPKGPTDIRCSQEAQFDVKTRSGVFVGNVKVVDPQFTLTTDRLAVRLNKEEEGGGLDEAQADGNVMIVHINQPKNGGEQSQGQAAAAPGAQPAAQAQQPVTSTGKAEKAVYEAKDGSITLTGWPQVTQGVNTHVATAPGVKMILYRDGRMQTYGSTRTLIQDRTATNKPNANGAQ